MQPPHDKTITVLICDTHEVYREGVSSILARQPDIEVLAQTGSGREAVELSRRLHPRVVLTDIFMTDLKGYDVSRLIKKDHPDVSVIILTLYDEEEFLHRSLDAGAHGYLIKNLPASQLLYAIRSVDSGGQYISPRLLKDAIRQYEKPSEKRKIPYDPLTVREREILVLLAEGFCLKDVATHLNLSVKTVDVHKYNLMRKLDIHDRSRLIRYAIRRKLIEV